MLWASAIAFCYRSRLAKMRSVAKLGERRALVKGDVLGFAAFDFILRWFRARVTRVAVDLEIARIDADYCAGDAPGFRIPAHVITDFKSIHHDRPDV